MAAKAAFFFIMKIGLDAMGGDFAPEAAVKGAIMALEKLDKDSRIVLFGDKVEIQRILKDECVDETLFEIVPTCGVIEMGDHPVKAFQQKTESSIVVGFKYLVKGLIDGFASAGSTGAMMVGSFSLVKAIDGVHRPTIATAIPTITGKPVLIMDVGLNVDCKPEVLEQYALIGSIYASSVLGIENPRVALLNIGEEEAKGNAQAKAAYDLMREASKNGRYNFVGNVEASYIYTSKIADVVICDGFVGNTILKLTEGLYAINHKMTEDNKFWGGLNYEKAGGTPVLGINAPVTIGHGKSTPLAICNMILSTENTIATSLVPNLKSAFR